MSTTLAILFACTSSVACTLVLFLWLKLKNVEKGTGILRESYYKLRENDLELSKRYIKTVAENRKQERSINLAAGIIIAALKDFDRILVCLWGNPPLKSRDSRDIIAAIEELKEQAQTPQQGFAWLVEENMRLNKRILDLQRQIEDSHAPGDAVIISDGAAS